MCHVEVSRSGEEIAVGLWGGGLYNSDWERLGGEEGWRGSVNRNLLSSPGLPSSSGRQLHPTSLLGSFLPLDLLFCGWALLLLILISILVCAWRLIYITCMSFFSYIISCEIISIT